MAGSSGSIPALAPSKDFLTRFSEMGVGVVNGAPACLPRLVPQAEFRQQPRTFQSVDSEGAPRIVVTGSDSSHKDFRELALDAAASAEIFGRTGTIQRLDVFYGLSS